MNLRTCEHCDSVFWAGTDAIYCPICAVMEKSREQQADRSADSRAEELEPIAG